MGKMSIKVRVLCIVVLCNLIIVGCNNDDDSGGAVSENGDITLYRVDGNAIIKVKDYPVTGKNLEFQKDTNKHQQIWNLTKQIVPKEHLTRITEFLIFGSNDGTLAFVSPKNGKFEKWQMGIEINAAFAGGFNVKGELTSTIVHEFGHVLTFDKSQADPTVSASDCTNYYDPDFFTCATDNSYLDNLYQKHWVDIWSDYKKIKNESQRTEFYNKNKTRFVTPYASTDPSEDIAEVFAAFVTQKDKPNGTKGADKKVQMLYDRPALVGLRNFIRGNISKNGKKALLDLESLKNTTVFGSTHKKCGFRKMNPNF